MTNCDHYLEAAMKPGFKAASEFSEDELSRVISSIADVLLDAPPANAWSVVLGATVVPEFGGEECCEHAPGGVILLSDTAVLRLLVMGNPIVTVEAAQKAPIWRDDRRAIYTFATRPEAAEPAEVPDLGSETRTDPKEDRR